MCGKARREETSIPPGAPCSLVLLLLLSCMSVGSFVFEKIVHHGMSCSLRCNDSALGRLDFSKFSNSSGGKCFHKKLFGESLALTFLSRLNVARPLRTKEKEEAKSGKKEMKGFLHYCTVKRRSKEKRAAERLDWTQIDGGGIVGGEVFFVSFFKSHTFLVASKVQGKKIRKCRKKKL